MPSLRVLTVTTGTSSQIPPSTSVEWWGAAMRIVLRAERVARPWMWPRNATPPRYSCVHAVAGVANSFWFPSILAEALFVYQAASAGDPGGLAVLSIELIAVLAGLALLPLNRTSLREARMFYAWFLFVSALVADVDFTWMMARHLWFSDRAQDDPGKYFELARVSFGSVEMSDPGFGFLLERSWRLLRTVGEPTFLTLLDSIVILSSIFAAACLEISRRFGPRQALPFVALFVFNPLVLAFNGSLLRDMLLGSVGWFAVLFGLEAVEQAPVGAPRRMMRMVGYVAGCTAAYFLRTVSGLFFCLVPIVIASLSRRTKTSWVVCCGAVATVVGVGYAFPSVTADMLERSRGHAEDAAWIVDDALRGGSVAARFLGSFYGRLGITFGNTLLNGVPFWRAYEPTLANELLVAAGGAWSQMFTALPALLGMGYLTLHWRQGLPALVIYFGWCAAVAAMLQGEGRYVISHLLPVLAVFGGVGREVLKRQTQSRRVALYGLLFGAVFLGSLVIELVKRATPIVH